MSSSPHSTVAGHLRPSSKFGRSWPGCIVNPSNLTRPAGAANSRRGTNQTGDRDSCLAFPILAATRPRWRDVVVPR